MLEQAGIEAAEESVSYVLNFAADKLANTDRELNLEEREYEDERADKAKEERGDTTRAKNIGLTDAEVRYLMNYFGTPG